MVELSALGAELIFIPGAKNTAADALSRLHTHQAEDDVITDPILLPVKDQVGNITSYVYNNACLQAIASDELQNQLTLPLFAQEQRLDPSCAILIQALKGLQYQCATPSIARFVKHYFPLSVLDDEFGVIFVNISKNPDNPDFKVLVPKSLQHQVISVLHAIPSSGHWGFRRTRAAIFKCYTWKRASLSIARYVRGCRLCETFKGATQRALGRVRAVPIESAYHTLFWDAYGPLVTSVDRQKYIILTKDSLTSHVNLFPVPNLKAKTVIKGLIWNVFRTHGVPRVLVSDVGAPFNSNLFAEIYREFGIKARFSPVAFPRSEAAERAFRDLKPLLAMFAYENQKTWSRKLAEVQLALNTATDISGYTPSYLLFGREIRVPGDLIGSEQVIPNASLEFYSINLVHRLRAAIKKAIARKETIREHARIKLNKGASETQFKVSDLVWLRAHFQSSIANEFTTKLAPRHIGPFRVVERVSPDVYRLQDVASGIVRRHYDHIANLKPYYTEVVDGKALDTSEVEEWLLKNVPTTVKKTRRLNQRANAPFKL
jgi:hypothetical protein